MQSEHNFDGKLYTSATEAGRLFGYTKEYMLMHIKAGKIDGKKVKHKWYVHVPSAEKYFQEAKNERENRRQKLREIRKTEFRKHETVVHDDKKEISSVFNNHVRIAVLETLVIVFLGVSVGGVGYLGTTNSLASANLSEYGFFRGFAISVYDFFSEDRSETFYPRLVTPRPSVQNPEIQAISAHVGTTTYTSLAVSPDELFTLTTTSVQSIADSFSDDIEIVIDQENPQTAVITPQFKNGAGEEYRFMMVPLQVNSASE